MKTTIPTSSVIDAEFIKTCSHRTFRVVKELSPNLISNYIVADGNFPVISQAFQHARTVGDRNAIADFLHSIEKAVRGSSEEHMKFMTLDNLHDADPCVFFNFCRSPQIAGEEAARTIKSLQRALNRSMPNRKVEIERISKYVVRRLMGDQTARTPLLWGPPGSGKSELATQLVQSLTAIGIEAKAIFQVMTQENSPLMQNEGGMRLLGTSRHFSNGTPGELYTQVSNPDINLGLVLLDEADKTVQRDYLVGLLDPKTLLQDHYVREVISSMNLRSKSLMLLTANDPSKLNRGDADPLWSRLDPLFLRPYTAKEMIGLAVDVICSDTDNPYQPTPKIVRKLAKETVQQLEAESSFRAVLDQVNDRLFCSIAGLERPDNDCIRPPSAKERKPVGFGSEPVSPYFRGILR